MRLPAEEAEGSVRESAPPLRIAYLYHRADTMGGAPIHLRDLSRRLIDEGHEAKIFIGGEGPFLRNLEEHGVPYETLRYLQKAPNPFKDLPALFEVLRKLRAYRPQLVSAHSAKAGFVGRIAAKLLGIPAIYTPHCWPFSQGAPKAALYRLLERAVAPLGRRIYLVSENEREEALRHRVCPDASMTTIHNGMLDVDPALRADPAASPPRLIMVARFEAQKDHPTLFRALANLQHLEWSLDLVGGGPLEGRCRALAEELGIGDRVRFLGHSVEVPRLLSQSQIFVLATNWEGFPRSTLEAMRAGLPSVVTDVGGNREAFAAGGEGIAVAHRDVGALAEAIERLATDPALRRDMGARARSTYEERFTFETMYRRYLAEYRSLLGNPEGL